MPLSTNVSIGGFAVCASCTLGTIQRLVRGSPYYRGMPAWVCVLAVCMGGARVFVTTQGGKKKKAPSCIHPSPRPEPLCGWVL